MAWGSSVVKADFKAAYRAEDPAVVAAGVSVGLMFQESARKLLRAELLARGEVLAEALAANAPRGVETQNAFRSLDSLTASAAQRRDVAYARVFDRAGRLLAGARGGDGLGARLEVSDSGTGIPEAVLPRIFEPFFSTKETGKGTGLGLAIVHEIVSQQGGTIDVRGRPGGGTVFVITIPASEAA